MDGVSEGERAHGGSTGTEETLVETLAAPQGEAGFQLPRRGESVGRFLILERLGAGAMGTVLAAYDPSLDRRVALKFVQLDDATARARLIREAQALARIADPHVVTVHEVGEFGGGVYLAMEEVRGQDLRRWAEATKPSWREASRVYAQAALGLNRAHEAGLVHRDFKPDNCMIDEAGRVRVLDFGLARADQPQPGEPTQSREELLGVSAEQLERLRSQTSGSLDDAVELTRAGSLVGTPAYLSPEQCLGQAATPASDQFAFCVSLWECIYGERPFAGRSITELILAISNGELQDPPRPVGGEAVPLWMRQALRRGLSSDSEARWASMKELAELLMSAPRRRRSRALALAGGLALLGVGGASLAAARAPKPPPPCSGMESQLVGVWDDEQRESVRSSLDRLPVDFVRQSSERIVARFDQWSTRWLDARRDACLATRVRKEQSETAMDTRIACFDRQLETLRARVEVLGQLEAEQAASAARLAAALPSPLDCRSPQGRARPVDPAQQQALETAEAHLARAEAQERAGRYDEALAAADAALEAAELSRDPTARAEAKLARGSALMESGDYDAAVTELEAAYFSSLSEDIPAVQARSAGLLSFLGSEHGREAAKVARWQAHATAMVRRELPALVEASLQLNLGAVAFRSGDFEAARRYYEAALQTRRERLGSQDPEVAMVLNNLANAQQRLENLDVARALHEEALSIREASLGPDHPDTAMSHNNLGSLLKKQKDYSAAYAHLGRAITIKRKALGDEHPSVGPAYLNLASAQLDGKAYAKALVSADEAQARISKAFGEAHLYRAFALDSKGRAHYGLEDYEAAERRFRDAVAIAAKLEHPSVDAMRVRVAQALARRGRVADSRAALAAMQRPLTQNELRTLQADHPELGALAGQKP